MIMKKIFTSILMGILCMAGISVFAQPTIPATTLSVPDPTAVDAAGWSRTDKFYAVVENTIVFNAYTAYQNRGAQTWVAVNGSGSADREWNAQGVFQGSTYYGQDAGKYKVATTNSTRIYSFRVTNCVSVSALIKTGNTTRIVTLAAYEMSGETIGSTPDFSDAKSGSNSIFVSEISGLDKNKTYVVTINGTDGNSDFYEIAFTAPAVSSPTIDSFVVDEVSATIDNGTDPGTITAELPYGTNLTSLAPTITLGGTAVTCTPASGVVQNFTSPVTYTVYDATNAASKAYTVTLTVSDAPSSDKYISNLMVGEYAVNSDETTINLVIPSGASLTQTVSFDIPSTATADFTSGNTYNFEQPLNIVVTAQDDSQTTYTINVKNGTADIAYVSTNGVISALDTKIYPELSEDYFIQIINPTGADLTQFDSYDLVVLSENVGSSNTLAVAMGGLIGTKPFLNFKAYMHGKGSGWLAGTGVNGSADAQATIVEAYKPHPVFNGVTFADNIVTLLDSPAAKGLQGATTSGGDIIGNLVSGAACIVEENTNPSAKYMLIAIANDSYDKINTDGLKLISNTVTYLLSNDKFVPVITSIEDNADNAARVIISEDYYTLTGNKIKEVLATGVYIKKVTYDDGTISTFKVIEYK